MTWTAAGQAGLSALGSWLSRQQGGLGNGGLAAAAVTLVATVQSVRDGARAFAARFAGEQIIAETGAIQARQLGAGFVDNAGDPRQGCTDDVARLRLGKASDAGCVL
jgi:hypothetical protein